MIDPTAMEVDFSVLENELALIRVGDEVGISPFADPTHVAVGAVSEVNPLVDEDGLVRVKAVVRSSEGLFDGMNVRVRVRRSLDKQLVVPKGAVVMRSGKQVVFTLDGDKALWNYVRTGLENDSCYTIVEGLKPGDQVITSGNINLAHEAPVKVLP